MSITHDTNTINGATESTVAEIMTRPVKTISLNASVADTLRIMMKGITTLPVVDDSGHYVGIISRTDLMEALYEEDQQLARYIESEGLPNPTMIAAVDTCNERLVRELMSAQLTAATLRTTIKQACQLMSDNQIHHLPVVENGQNIVGIVSSLDLLNWFAQ